MYLFQTYTVEEALSLLQSKIRLDSPAEITALREALHRISAEDVFAPEDVPDFNRSTVDGYAVRARDTFGASVQLPVYLDIVGEVSPAQAPIFRLGAGQAFQIATGAMLPVGADAVVMLEDAKEFDKEAVVVTAPAALKENTISRGEDLKRGEALFSWGQRLRPQDIGLLAAAGVSAVKVQRPLRVGLITTGNEVVPIHLKPGAGQVRDVNSYTLDGQLRECGAEPVVYGIVGDNFTELFRVVRKALLETEAVVISGGSSIGRHDVTVDVLSEIGEPGILFHGLAVRPGRPTVAAVSGNKPVIGLPGHPVSAMVVFELLLRPLLDPGLRRFPITAQIASDWRSEFGAEDYVRVQIRRDEGNRLVADPISGKPGLIATMVRADGLARIPLDSPGVRAGEEVEVILVV